MTKGHEFNNSTNNSSALVTPTRSEIRLLHATKLVLGPIKFFQMFRKAAFVATFLLVIAIPACVMLDVQISRDLAAVLLLCASIGIIYCFRSLYERMGGWNGIVNHEEK